MKIPVKKDGFLINSILILPLYATNNIINIMTKLIIDKNGRVIKPKKSMYFVVHDISGPQKAESPAGKF